MRSLSTKQFSAFAALAFLLSTGSAMATDISGVRLGMTVSEAKTSFTKPTNFKVIPVQTNNNESGFAGWRGNTVFESSFQGPSDEFLAFKGLADGIWFIQRNQRLAATERYGRENLVEAARKKYGKESFLVGQLNEKHGNVLMAWEFKPNGQQYFGTALDGPCQMYDVGSIGRNRLNGENFLPPPMSISIPTEFNRSCGRVFYVEWMHDADGLVRDVALRAIDSAAMLRTIDGKTARDEADAQQRTQQQIKKGVKPNL